MNRIYLYGLAGASEMYRIVDHEYIDIENYGVGLTVDKIMHNNNGKSGL